MAKHLPFEVSTSDDPLPTRPSLLARLQNQQDSSTWNRGWTEFFKTYHSIILHQALRASLNDCDAEEVVCAVVDGVRRGLQDFVYDPERCSFKTWLYRVTRNKIADLQRKQARQYRLKSMATEDASEEIANLMDTQTLSPDAAWDIKFEISMRQHAIEQVARRVKPMTMRLYLYHIVEGHSVDDTVRNFADFQVDASAVYLAHHRVHKMVTEEYEKLLQGKPMVS